MQAKTLLNKIMTWGIELITKRISITLILLLVSLTFFHGSPVTLTFGDGKEIVLLEALQKDLFLAKVLLIMAVLEITGVWGLIPSMVGKTLALILRGIKKSIQEEP